MVSDLFQGPTGWFEDASGRALRGESPVLELGVRCRDVSSRPVECVLAGTDEGKPLVPLCRDITECERRAVELEGRMAALEALAKAAPPAIARSRDRREAVQEIVTAARAITGADHANLLLFSRDGRLVETFDPVGTPRVPVCVRRRGFSS